MTNDYRLGQCLQGLFSGGRPHLAQAKGSSPAQGQVTQLPDGLVGRSSGAVHAIPSAVLAKMEKVFNSDFSGVRVHVGGAASSIGAVAFTMGNDIHFAPGHYNPHSPQGQQLLGHELAHVVQQRMGRVNNPFGGGVALVQNPALEAEADRMGLKAMMQAKAAPGGGCKLVVGAYLHQGQVAASLPPQLAGHAFVSIQGPTGQARTFGFSPANLSGYDPRRDLGKLTAGVKGRVHDDTKAFSKPGVRTRAFDISPQQAQAAMAKINEYKGSPNFSLAGRQCITFAADVARAAGVRNFSASGARQPNDFYRKL